MTLKHTLLIGGVIVLLSMNMYTIAAAGVSLPQVQGPIPVTASSVPFNAVAQQTTPLNLDEVGYMEEEYFLSGKANVYKWNKPGTAEVRTPDVPYTNRVMVRKPADPKKFSGNVFVEVVNSTSTYDSQVHWYACHPKFFRDGDIYVGITSKPIAVSSLKKYDPERYAPLSWANPLPPEERGENPGDYMPQDIPGSTPENEDGLFWDMLTQLGALLKSDAPANPVKGYKVEMVYATGASQSSIALTTYINAIHPNANLGNGKPVYDGYFLTVGAYPLQINQDADIIFPADDPRAVIRNCNVPVIRMMSETDFRSMGPWPFIHTRRKDSDDPQDRFRLYEVPGSSHATWYPNEFRSGPKELEAIGVKTPPKPDYIINKFPFYYLFRGALVNLDKWVREGTPPPHAPSFIAVDFANMEKDVFGNTVPAIMRDEFGNALGGLRTPYVDLPYATYCVYPKDNPLSGYMIPFGMQKFEQLYSNRAAYLQKFAAYVDTMVKERWVTEADGELMKQDAGSQSLLP